MSGAVYLFGIGEDVVWNGLPKDKGEDKPTKGWACVVRKSTVNDLDQKLGPTPKRVWTGKIARLCNKVLIPYG